MELHLGPVRLERNPLNGQFLPGHTSPQKGRSRTEWLSPEVDKRLRAQAAQFMKRPRPHTGGCKKHPIVMVTDDGRFCRFESSGDAAQKMKIWDSAVRRCARHNLLDDENSDHKYKGVRWYYEDDNKWIAKIKKT